MQNTAGIHHKVSAEMAGETLASFRDDFSKLIVCNVCSYISTK